MCGKRGGVGKSEFTLYRNCKSRGHEAHHDEEHVSVRIRNTAVWRAPRRCCGFHATNPNLNNPFFSSKSASILMLVAFIAEEHPSANQEFQPMGGFKPNPLSRARTVALPRNMTMTNDANHFILYVELCILFKEKKRRESVTVCEIERAN